MEKPEMKIMSAREIRKWVNLKSLIFNKKLWQITCRGVTGEKFWDCTWASVHFDIF
jgi:hypothetical protein